MSFRPWQKVTAGAVVAWTLVACSGKQGDDDAFGAGPGVQLPFKQYTNLTPGTEGHGYYNNDYATVSSEGLTINTGIDLETPVPAGVVALPHHVGDVVYDSRSQQYGRLDVMASFPVEHDARGNPTQIGKPVLMWWPSNDNWPSGVEIDFAEITDITRQSGSINIHFADIDGSDAPPIHASFSADLTRPNKYSVIWTEHSLELMFNNKRVVLVVDAPTGQPGEIIEPRAIPYEYHRSTFQVDAAGVTPYEGQSVAPQPAMIVHDYRYTPFAKLSPDSGFVLNAPG